MGRMCICISFTGVHGIEGFASEMQCVTQDWLK